MFGVQSVDVLSVKLERVNVLADLLFTLLVDNPRAQTLAEIIMDLSTLPED